MKRSAKVLKKNARRDPAQHGLTDFDDLKTTTATVMVYTNLTFNLNEIFKTLPINEIEVPLTKKQKNVDKKKLSAPYGYIISVQSVTQIRGVDLRKKKTRWCTVCQPYRKANGRESKVNTISEYLESSPDTDVKSIKYYCSKCQWSYDPCQQKKISHFLNQLTIVLSVGTQPLLNIMMFKNNLKIAGCKDKDDAIEAIMILWQEYFIHHPDTWKLKKGAISPRFQFDGVMRNVGFGFGFPLEKDELNDVLNDDKYSETVFMSHYESTSQPSVNVKLFSEKPADHTYECLVMPFDKKPYIVAIPELTYRKKKKKDGTKFTTAIIFSSSQAILSGKYHANMKEAYEFLVDVIFRHRKLVEERIVKNSRKLTLRMA